MYKPEAVLGLSNHGGVSIMLDKEDPDYLYYQWYEEEPVRTLIIYRDLDEMGNMEACFMIEQYLYSLQEFMKI